MESHNRRECHEETWPSDAPHDSSPVDSHFNNWPNAAGFASTKDVIEPIALLVQGEIPRYCLGTLYRAGPGSRNLVVDGRKVYHAEHWFDGLCQLHKFEILPSLSSSTTRPRVRYRSRHLLDGCLRKVHAEGKLDLVTFGQPQDPCESLFRRLQSAFIRALSFDPNKPVTPIVHVTPFCLQSGDQTSPGTLDSEIKVGTDCNALMTVDAQTLDMEALTSQTALHPAMRGPMCGAHYAEDPRTGDRYNYNLDFGYTASYRVFKIDGRTGETEIVATITDAPAAYLHSICISTNYVILCVWGARFSLYGLKVLYTSNILDALDELDPNQPCLWYVIDRSPGRRGVVAKYESSAMFAFHCVNAFEEASIQQAGEVDLFVDIPCYPDLSILKRFYYDNMTSSSPSAQSFASDSEAGSSARPQYTRFRLPNVETQNHTGQLAQAEVAWRMAPFETIELPSVNPSHLTRKHRYAYGLVDRGLSTFVDGIGKIDCGSQSIQVWSVDGHTPGEPVFIADPEAEDEDAGVLLSVVLNGHSGKSYLLILDASSLSEVARAEVDMAVPLGFHGVHVPQRSL